MVGAALWYTEYSYRIPLKEGRIYSSTAESAASRRPSIVGLLGIISVKRATSAFPGQPVSNDRLDTTYNTLVLGLLFFLAKYIFSKQSMNG